MKQPIRIRRRPDAYVAVGVDCRSACPPCDETEWVNALGPHDHARRGAVEPGIVHVNPSINGRGSHGELRVARTQEINYLVPPFGVLWSRRPDAYVAAGCSQCLSPSIGSAPKFDAITSCWLSVNRCRFSLKGNYPPAARTSRSYSRKIGILRYHQCPDAI